MNTIEQSIAEMVGQALRDYLGNLPAVKTEEPTDRGAKIRGIRGLAAYLECSSATAQSLKNKGKIPFSEVGNRLIFYSGEVEAAIKGGVK